jgi:anti-sigma28 factor (negative regulator of flagellin synthesis)
MCNVSQTPPVDAAMNTSINESPFPSDVGSTGGNAQSMPTARLQAIHDLIRTGNYHVPAAAVADRMVELMIAGKWRRHY